MVFGFVLMSVGLSGAQAQNLGVVPSELQIESGGYRTHVDEDGDIQAIEMAIHVEYDYDRGAVATDSTQIHLGIKEAPDGFVATLGKQVLEVPVDPRGGQESRQVHVTMLPSDQAAKEDSARAEFGIIKVIGHAQDNGNVQGSTSATQQLVPLKADQEMGNGTAEDAEPASASTAGASTGTAGAAAVGGGLVGALAGVGAGALVGRRYL